MYAYNKFVQNHILGTDYTDYTEIEHTNRVIREIRAYYLKSQHALKLMSSPLTECVSAPTEMKSTPHSA